MRSSSCQKAEGIQIAANVVHHSAERPSFIVLSLLKKK
jgi:hypothetical protein